MNKRRVGSVRTGYSLLRPIVIYIHHVNNLVSQNLPIEPRETPPTLLRLLAVLALELDLLWCCICSSVNIPRGWLLVPAAPAPADPGAECCAFADPVCWFSCGGRAGEE